MSDSIPDIDPDTLEYVTVELEDDDSLEWMVAKGYATRDEGDENSCTATPEGNAYLKRVIEKELKGNK